MNWSFKKRGQKEKSLREYPNHKKFWNPLDNIRVHSVFSSRQIATILFPELSRSWVPLRFTTLTTAVPDLSGVTVPSYSWHTLFLWRVSWCLSSQTFTSRFRGFYEFLFVPSPSGCLPVVDPGKIRYRMNKIPSFYPGVGDLFSLSLYPTPTSIPSLLLWPGVSRFVLVTECEETKGSWIGVTDSKFHLTQKTQV